MTRRTLLLFGGTALSGFAGWQQSTPRRRTRYDPATEATFHGKAEDVKDVSGTPGGVHVQLKTETGTFDVHVGPAFYLRSKEFEILKGDVLDVTGSKLKIEEKDAILARTITKNGKTLELRDKTGLPLWQGARRGRTPS